MMVNRSHQKDPFSSALKPEHLNDHAQSFCHENATDDHPYDLMLGQNSYGAQRATQRQTARIAHKDCCRRGIVPQKA